MATFKLFFYFWGCEIPEQHARAAGAEVTFQNVPAGTRRVDENFGWETFLTTFGHLDIELITAALILCSGDARVEDQRRSRRSRRTGRAFTIIPCTVLLKR